MAGPDLLFGYRDEVRRTDDLLMAYNGDVRRVQEVLFAYRGRVRRAYLKTAPPAPSGYVWNSNPVSDSGPADAGFQTTGSVQVAWGAAGFPNEDICRVSVGWGGYTGQFTEDWRVWDSADDTGIDNYEARVVSFVNDNAGGPNFPGSDDPLPGGWQTLPLKGGSVSLYFAYYVRVGDTITVDVAVREINNPASEIVKRYTMTVISF